MSKIKSAVRRGSIFSCSVNETCFEMNFIANYEFCRNILLASLDSSLADMKILSVKTTMVLKLRWYYDVISYVNIVIKPGNFLAWGPNQFVGIWHETDRC